MGIFQLAVLQEECFSYWNWLNVFTAHIDSGFTLALPNNKGVCISVS